MLSSQTLLVLGEENMLHKIYQSAIGGVSDIDLVGSLVSSK